MDRIVEPGQLPQKYVAWGHCFRPEAGAYGACARGLYRVHQFTKVEMFAACRADYGGAATAARPGEALLQEMLCVERALFDALELHYRVLMMPAADLGAPAYCKYDIEAWMPGRGAWGELSSASHCTDYQARRLNARYRAPVERSGGAVVAAAALPSIGGRPRPRPLAFLHTVNATALAVPRVIVALLETHQQPDGTVAVPRALHRYLGGLERLRKPP
jgi:seryl-tRNA synthetase